MRRSKVCLAWGGPMALDRVLLALAAGAVTIATPAGAQQARKLNFGLQASVEHDTNVAQSSAELAELRGIARADTIFTPSANVDLYIPVSRQSLFLQGSAGYTFYDKNSELDRARVNLTGGINTQAGPCRATFSGGLFIGQSELTDISLLASVENVQETKRASADLSCSRPTGLGVVFSASKDWTDNSLALLEQSNAERLSLMTGVTYGRPTLGTFTLFASHDETEYPNRFIAPGVTDGYESQALGLTYARQLGARLQGTVTVAQTKVDPKSSALIGVPAQDFTGTTYSGSLSFRATSRLRADASFSRAITPSTGIGQQYDLQTGYQLGFDYDIGSRFILSGGFAQNESEAHGILPPTSLTLTDSTTRSVFGALRYRHSDRLTLTLNARRDEREANSPQFDYASNRVGISANVAF